MYSLIVPLGIITYVSLLITFLIGKRIIKFKFKVHKIFGTITLIAGTMHAGLVIYLSYF